MKFFSAFIAAAAVCSTTLGLTVDNGESAMVSSSSAMTPLEFAAVRVGDHLSPEGFALADRWNQGPRGS